MAYFTLKERILREQANLQSQREKELKAQMDDTSRPSPQPVLPQQPISPLNQQQHSNMSAPLSNSSVDLDSNSQFSPPPPPPPPAPAAPVPVGAADSSSAPPPATTAPASDTIKRVQSIQELREQERRRREEIAGKIDMNEQHKLFAQFEQNLH